MTGGWKNDAILGIFVNSNLINLIQNETALIEF